MEGWRQTITNDDWIRHWPLDEHGNGDGDDSIDGSTRKWIMDDVYSRMMTKCCSLERCKDQKPWWQYDEPPAGNETDSQEYNSQRSVGHTCWINPLINRNWGRYWDPGDLWWLANQNDAAQLPTSAKSQLPNDKNKRTKTTSRIRTEYRQVAPNKHEIQSNRIRNATKNWWVFASLTLIDRMTKPEPYNWQIVYRLIPKDLTR